MVSKLIVIGLLFVSLSFCISCTSIKEYPDYTEIKTFGPVELNHCVENTETKEKKCTDMDAEKTGVDWAAIVASIVGVIIGFSL